MFRACEQPSPPAASVYTDPSSAAAFADGGLGGALAGSVLCVLGSEDSDPLWPLSPSFPPE